MNDFVYFLIVEGIPLKSFSPTSVWHKWNFYRTRDYELNFSLVNVSDFVVDVTNSAVPENDMESERAR